MSYFHFHYTYFLTHIYMYIYMYIFQWHSDAILDSYGGNQCIINSLGFFKLLVHSLTPNSCCHSCRKELLPHRMPSNSKGCHVTKYVVSILHTVTTAKQPYVLPLSFVPKLREESWPPRCQAIIMMQTWCQLQLSCLTDLSCCSCFSASLRP